MLEEAKIHFPNGAAVDDIAIGDSVWEPGESQRANGAESKAGKEAQRDEKEEQQSETQVSNLG